ncbi:MAG: NAD(P)-binding domain-containing protein [Paracoccus sp. (in: a-proteobacteria)]|nr:NAD(P)-binding domain-containing protein [Paracoccus sp. (in: a-proteobacteria)]
MSLKIALIGAGAMGGAIGARLLDTGQTLTVFDLNTDAVKALTDKGATGAESAAQAAAAADYVITSLNAPHIVQMAVFGTDGVAQGAKPGTDHRHVLDRSGGHARSGAKGR